MGREYSYVGPESLRATAHSELIRCVVRSAMDIVAWIRETEQTVDSYGMLTATFVVLTDRRFVISDRHSEHVACAQGRPVLSAGEITFELTSPGVTVDSVTNQSTGYCPEPESWPSVAEAIEASGLGAPDGFQPGFTFRRCEACGAINIVKEQVFECAVCGADLNPSWNFSVQNK